MAAFPDNFSDQARAYSRHRPRYPERVFAHVAALAPGTERVWDCATGNGQAALGLAAHFDEVVATDASESQLANASPHPRVTYRLAPAEDSGLPDSSVDLVYVAQALHWFHFDRFYAEVRRVLRAGGLLAATIYQHTVIDPAIDAILRRFHDEVVGPYWPPQTKWSHVYYETIPFPFDELEPPRDLAAEATWTYPDLLGYLESWSATQRYGRAHGQDPVETIREQLEGAWGPPETERPVAWPLVVRIGRPVSRAGGLSRDGGPRPDTSGTRS
ncbi:MAG: class I SAM-dependent methyltransferase [Planctomycetota bacterium]|jgi:ubiquinone/menaquinone biosynthesis C-methylase UbiE